MTGYLFDMELGFIEPEKRAKCARFAKVIVERSIERESVPSPLTSIKTHTVDGKIIDRKCGNCGEWDITGKTFARCSVRMHAGLLRLLQQKMSKGALEGA